MPPKGRDLGIVTRVLVSALGLGGVVDLPFENFEGRLGLVGRIIAASRAKQLVLR